SPDHGPARGRTVAGGVVRHGGVRVVAWGLAADSSILLSHIHIFANAAIPRCFLRKNHSARGIVRKKAIVDSESRPRMMESTIPVATGFSVSFARFAMKKHPVQEAV